MTPIVRMCRSFGVTLVVICCAEPAIAQGVQAVVGGLTAADDARMDSLATAVQSHLKGHVADLAGPAQMADSARLANVVRLGNELIAAANRHDADAVLRIEPQWRAAERALSPANAAAVTPQFFIVAHNVVFVLSGDWTVDRSTNVGTVGVNTNLLGTAVGTAFDALGSASLKSYFTENLAAGTAVPLNGSAHLTGQIGLGIGGVSFLGLTFWPAINLEQMDSSDTRVPRALATRRADVKNWSQPIIAIAVLPKSFIARLTKGQAAFAITMGVRLPYFYPGDPFAGLAALFSTKRNDFERQGKAAFVLGLAIPFYEVKPDAGKGGTLGTNSASTFPD